MQGSFSMEFNIQPDSKENIVFNDDLTVKGATVNKLIEKIVLDREMDPKIHSDLENVFFQTYVSFITPYQLLDKFVSLFFKCEKDNPENAKRFVDTNHSLRHIVL